MKKALLGLFAVVLLVSCKKQIDELPETTETGSNTFGVKLNNELWGPMKQGVMYTPAILEARFFGPTTLKINARNFASTPKESEMEIYLLDVNETGTYPLNQNTSEYPNADGNYIYYVERTITPTNEWITSSKYTGSVTITKLDRVKKIVAGTFNFSSVSMGLNPKTLHATEGRFDIKLP